MKAVTGVLFGALLLSGCVHHVVYVPAEERIPAEGEPDEAYLEVEDECEPVWDGHAWLEITLPHHHHGPGCGHYFHHGCWHLWSERHVYLEFGWAPFGVTESFFYEGEPCARCWDGCEFIVIRHHVHGPGCGHYFHHGCWNTCREDHVFTETHHGHFSVAPPVSHHEHHGDHDLHHEAGRAPAPSKAPSHVEPERSARKPVAPGRLELQHPQARPPAGPKVKQDPAPPRKRIDPAAKKAEADKSKDKDPAKKKRK